MEGTKAQFIDLATCPACAGQRIRRYKKGTYAGRLTQDEIKITDSQYGRVWDLSLCLDCGHIFANPCPSPDFIFSLYGEVCDPEYEEEAAGRSRNFLPILESLERVIPERGALFDVGAATGILLDLARSRGWEPDGIEPSSWAVKTAAEKYGLALRHGPFETACLKGNAYAAVLMVDFIEHTPLPHEAVVRAQRILRPAGILVLVTPDIRSPAARIAGRRWWHLRPAHLAFFSRASLQALLSRAGFTIIEERRYAWTFSAHYLLSRKRLTRVLLKNSAMSSFFKRIPIKLALGDSFEIYARKDRNG
ncbi:MAG: class I SAM-dependent methyltransferase [Clostridiales bacterium]|nr:class I SAM-dependent methyltransferase [Clostridiales bacterium]